MSARPERSYRELVRTILRAEKGLRGYRPTPRDTEPPREPPGADEVLAALAARYRPGDAIGLQQIVDCIGVTWEHARAVRAWAQHPAVGAWPYLQPAPSRPAGKNDPRTRTRRRKRGTS